MNADSQDGRNRIEAACREILERNQVCASRVAFWEKSEDKTCLFCDNGIYYVGYMEPGRGLVQFSEYRTVEEAVFRLLGEEIYYSFVVRHDRK